MKPGDRLRNRYRIEKPLAVGGFGATYLAIDLEHPGNLTILPDRSTAITDKYAVY
jgi:hypothetical protein